MAKIFDNNHDLRISKQEYINHLSKISYNVKIVSPFYPDLRDRPEQDLKRKVAEAFALFDANKSGRLNKF